MPYNVDLGTTIEMEIAEVVLADGENILMLVAEMAERAETAATEAEKWAVGTVEEQPLGSAKTWAEAAKEHADKSSEMSAVAGNNAELARKWAIGTITEQPLGSAKYWAEQAANAAVFDVKIAGISIVNERVADIPIATPDAPGVMSKTDKERLDLLSNVSYITWNGTKYEFVNAQQNFTEANFPTVQVGFLGTNPIDNPVINVNGIDYDVYVAGHKARAGEIFANDTCFMSFKNNRVDTFALDSKKAFSISNNPTDLALTTEQAVKTYVDNQFTNTSALGQGVWYYTNNTTLSEIKPTSATLIAFALSGTGATSRTFVGTFNKGGFFSPSASYIKVLHLSNLLNEVNYTITFDYKIKGITIWTYSQQITTISGQSAADIIINVPSSSTYNSKINWNTGDTYQETITISKNISGNNHTINITQTPNNGQFSYMQRNGGVLYSSELFDTALNKSQADINSGIPATTISATGGALILDYKVSTVFKHTATSNISISLANMPSGMTNMVALELSNGGAYVVSHPTNCKFAGGAAPLLTLTGKDILLYYYNGTDVFCSVQKDVK